MEREREREGRERETKGSTVFLSLAAASFTPAAEYLMGNKRSQRRRRARRAQVYRCLAAPLCFLAAPLNDGFRYRVLIVIERRFYGLFTSTPLYSLCEMASRNWQFLFPLALLSLPYALPSLLCAP